MIVINDYKNILQPSIMIVIMFIVKAIVGMIIIYAHNTFLVRAM